MPSLQRKFSTLTLSSLPRSSSPASSHNARPLTPQSPRPNAPPNERRHSGLRYILSNSRKHQAQSEIMTPPSSPSATQPSPVIPKLTKVFADSLNTTQLSNFLVWMLYFDIVERPSTPESWYKCIDNTDMHGWVALGKFLTKSRKAGTEYGFDLVVLDSICDRIHLSRGTVHELLIRFADPEQMRYAAVASTNIKAQEDGCSKIEVLEAVRAKLHELNRLAANLQPQSGSGYEEELAIIRKRLRGFLHLVIGPRIANLKWGSPLVTVTTSDHVPRDIQEGIRFNYLFEEMQQERIVPSRRYGSGTGSVYSAAPAPSSSLPHLVDKETERARNLAIGLMTENSKLHAVITELQNDKNKLTTSNEKLARKIAAMSRMQPAGYNGSPPHSECPTPKLACSSLDSMKQTTAQKSLQCVRSRPISMSTSAVPTLTIPLDSKSRPDAYMCQHPDIQTSQYDDIFFRLKSSPLPPLELSDPFTAGPASSPSAALTSTPQSMVADRKSSQLGDLEVFRTVGEEDEENNEGAQEGRYLSGRPRPEARNRFD